MGVKSTVRLTRRRAEEKYVDLLLETYRQPLRAQAAVMEDKRLENDLQSLNDEAHDGEGFENYLITEHGDDV